MMNKLWRSAILAATAVVGMGGVVTAVQLGGEASRVPQAAPQALSSQDVYRAVVFGQGALARQLADHPALRDFYRASYAVSNDAKQLAVADEVMERISTADPSYLARFAGAIRSGNPYIVSDALGGVEPELQKVGFPSDAIAAPPARANFHINTSFNMNWHTNINIALNENVAVNLNTVWPQPGSQSAAFQRELVVGGITAALRA